MHGFESEGCKSLILIDPLGLWTGEVHNSSSQTWSFVDYKFIYWNKPCDTSQLSYLVPIALSEREKGKVFSFLPPSISPSLPPSFPSLLPFYPPLLLFIPPSSLSFPLHSFTPSLPPFFLPSLLAFLSSFVPPFIPSPLFLSLTKVRYILQ